MAGAEYGRMIQSSFQLGCELTYAVTSQSVFLFNVQVARTGRHRVSEERLELDPQVPADEFEMTGTGNRIARVTVQPCTLRVRYSAVVEPGKASVEPAEMGEVAISELPPETVRFLFPSRYCQSDKLLRFATHHFGSMTPGYGRVQAICDWIYGNIEYLRGTTTAQTSAFDTVTERAGVCRDFAHLGIALCRALNIPARFVTGYAHKLEPPDFHAYFEAYLGETWQAFDATRLVPAEGLVRIGAGVDAAQASFASIFGAATMSGMQVKMERVS